MEECLICTEEFDTKKRKKIECPYCQQIACMSCYMITILNSLEEASCMFPNCTSKDNNTLLNKPWNIQFLTDNFPKTYVWGPGTNVKVKDIVKKDGSKKKQKSLKRSYRQHREEMMVDQQMALMPSTQPIVEKEMKIKKLYNERKDINKKLKKRTDPVLTIRRNDIGDELKELKNPLNIKREKRVKIVNRGSCPKDTCNGFIGSGWMCGICETNICQDCREIILSDQKRVKIENEMLKINDLNYMYISLKTLKFVLENKIHNCDQNILKTMHELSKKNYRSCPQCRVFIEKSYGCSQMFCTNCNIFFDWNSGKQIKKTNFVHNPHYQDWVEQGQQGRQVPIVGDCEVNFQNINKLDILKQNKTIFNNVIRFINEIREQNHSMNPTENLEKSLLTIRKRFLSGHYGTDSEKAKQKLGIETQRSYKRESKTNEILQIREMYSETSSQIIARLLLDIKNKHKPKPKPKNIITKIMSPDPFLTRPKKTEKFSFFKFIRNLLFVSNVEPEPERVENHVTSDVTNRNYDVTNHVTSDVTNRNYAVTNHVTSDDPVGLYYQEVDLMVYESINQLKNIYNYANTNIYKLSLRYNSGIPRLSQYNFRPSF